MCVKKNGGIKSTLDANTKGEQGVSLINSTLVFLNKLMKMRWYILGVVY